MIRSTSDGLWNIHDIMTSLTWVVKNTGGQIMVGSHLQQPTQSIERDSKPFIFICDFQQFGDD